MMQVVPIIIPSQVERDCIVVDMHKYCRDVDMTAKDIGYIMIFVVCAIAYVLFLMHLSDIYDNMWILGLGIVVPILLVAAGFIIT